MGAQQNSYGDEECVCLPQKEAQVEQVAVEQAHRACGTRDIIANACFILLLFVGVTCIGYGAYMLGETNGRHYVHESLRKALPVSTPPAEEWEALNAKCGQQQGRSECLGVVGCGICEWQGPSESGTACVAGDFYGPYDVSECCNQWFAVTELSSEQCDNARRGSIFG